MAAVDSPARLRMTRTALFPVGLLALCAVPLAFAAPWTPVLLLSRWPWPSGCSGSASTSPTTG